MIQEQNKSTQRKRSPFFQFFQIFNILIALANIGIGVYMLTIYCDSDVIVVAAFSLLFGLLNLFQLFSQKAQTPSYLRVSIFISIFVMAASIAGVVNFNNYRFCYYITCAEGIISKFSSSDRSLCDQLTIDEERRLQDVLLYDKYEGGYILAAVPIALGAIQIVFAAMLGIISYFGVSSECRHKKKLENELKI